MHNGLRKLGKAMQALKTRMDNADEVRIQGPDTNLTFSIKDIPTVICDGKLNIPTARCTQRR